MKELNQTKQQKLKINFYFNHIIFFFIYRKIMTVCVGTYIHGCIKWRSFSLLSIRLPASNLMVKLSCVRSTQSLSLSVYVPRQHLAASWVLMELPKVIPYPFVAEWMFGSWPVSQKPSTPFSWDEKNQLTLLIMQETKLVQCKDSIAK